MFKKNTEFFKGLVKVMWENSSHYAFESRDPLDIFYYKGHCKAYTNILDTYIKDFRTLVELKEETEKHAEFIYEGNNEKDKMFVKGMIDAYETAMITYSNLFGFEGFEEQKNILKVFERKMTGNV